MSRVTNDMDTISQAFGFALVSVTSGILLIAWVAFNMLRLSVPYALVSLAVVPVMWLVTNWFSGQARQGVPPLAPGDRPGQRRPAGEHRGRARGAGVRPRGREHRGLPHVERGEPRRQRPRRRVHPGALARARRRSGYVAVAITTVVGGIYLLSGQSLGGTVMSLGLIITFLGYVQRFNQPVQQISTLWTNLQSAIAGAERIFGLLDEQAGRGRQAGRARDARRSRARSSSTAWARRYKKGQPVLGLRQLRGRAGPDRGHRRPDRRGQDDDHQPDPALLRRDERRGAHRRPGRARRQRRKPAAPDRHRAAGHVPLQRHGDEQHPVRPARCDGRGSDGRGHARPRRRVHRAAARRLQHGARRARQRREPGPAPAARHRPGRAGRPAHPDPRRGDVERGHPHRAADPGRARSPRSPGGRASSSPTA